MYTIYIDVEQLYTAKNKLKEVQELAINHKCLRTSKWLIDYAVKLQQEIQILEELQNTYKEI